VLEQLDPQLVRLRGEHGPHRAGLGAVEVREHRVREVRAGRVARCHRLAVTGVEGGVETLDQLLVGGAHGAEHVTG
jgi:hypothetical protein